MGEPFVQSAPGLFLLESWIRSQRGLVAGFTSRQGGESTGPFAENNLSFQVGDAFFSVLQNRRKVAARLHFSLKNWVFAGQVHGTSLHSASSADRGKGAEKGDTAIPGTDGLYTAQRGIMLALTFADCVPIYFFSPSCHLIGIVHAGWRGTAGRIAPRLIEKWKKLGVPASDMRVAIGPSICGNCYLVDEAVIGQFRNGGVRTENIRPVGNGQYALDLKQINYDWIRSAGIPEENIAVSSWCTSCRTDLFYSHRRDRGKTGRMLGFIGMREDRYL